MSVARFIIEAVAAYLIEARDGLRANRRNRRTYDMWWP